MDDPTPQILKDQLVRDPDFGFLEAIRAPLLATYAQELEWWYYAFRWQLNCYRQWIRDNDTYFNNVAPGGSILNLRDPACARPFAAERATYFVRQAAECLAYGALYFDDRDNLACRNGPVH